MSSAAKKKYYHHQHHHGFNNYSSSLSPSSVCKKTNHHHCCVFCSCSHHSPTSTLLGMSHFSPPMSPMSGVAVNYKDALTDLMSSLEAMHFSDNNNSSSSGPVSPISPMSTANNKRPNGLPWLDVSSFGDDQPQFVLSPSTPSSVAANNQMSGHASENFFAGKRYNNNSNYSTTFCDDQSNSISDNNGGSNSDPDLGWVNELLM